MKFAFVLIAALGFFSTTPAQEIKVMLDNEWVKVSRILDRPGDKRATHSHKDTVVIALSDHRRRVVGDKTQEFDIKAGQAMWFAEVTHSEENIGKTDGELLIVEVKKPAGSWKPAAGADDPNRWPASLDAVAAAPGNHKVVLENERVRVLDVTVHPGENEPLHMHRMPSVLYIIAEDDIQDFDADGKLLYDTRAQKDPPKTPFAEWMPPQAAHRVVNRSKNALRLIRVELK
jgi:mannose-6-phosphate isomerase-like protein (cupin superfamily)